MQIKNSGLTLKGKVNFIASENILLFFCIIFILPFLMISIFNNPAADDFTYYCRSRDLGFLNAQYDWYINWSGRYFSTAILSLKILKFESFILIKLIPILLILALLYSIYMLISFVFKNLKKKEKIIISALFLTFYLMLMPSVSQGFYWLSSSITYQLPNILSIHFLIFFIKLLETNKTKYAFLSIILCFFIIGSNETSMLYIDFFIIFVIAFNYFFYKKINYTLLVVLFFSLLFSIIVYKSPGNDIRSISFPNRHQFIFSMLKSGFITLLFIVYLLPITLLLVHIVPQYFFKKFNFHHSKIFEINPIYVLFLIVFVTFLGFFTGYWSLGKHSPSRTINTIFFYYLIGISYFTFTINFYLQHNNKSINFPLKWRKPLLISIVIILFFQNRNILNLYSDLMTASAYNYNLELTNRYKAIGKSKNDIMYVDKLKNLPTTLFFDDITNDTKDWRNVAYSSYFYKKSISLKNK